LVDLEIGHWLLVDWYMSMQNSNYFLLSNHPITQSPNHPITQFPNSPIPQSPIHQMHRILLVEDEEHIRDMVKLNLELDGYEVVAASNGRTALKRIREEHFDILLLDVMLPEVDGFQVAEQVRINNLDVPILFLTAKNNPNDRITGLKKGGDDYLTKPFELEELQLRIQKLIRRSQKNGAASLDIATFGDNQVDFQSYKAIGTQGEFMLTKKEAMLLKLLIERKNEVVSRQQILQAVWGYDVYPSTRTIDNFILSFRKYFEADTREPRYFHSIRGVGYKFVL
jgi:two-component system, OmpR family, alkaline phosphatase synthesis response regulator PhoP